MSAIIVMKAGFGLLGPIALQHLLAYLESRSSDNSEEGRGSIIIRPWVWIVALFVGPVAGTVVWETYVYITTRMIVRTEAIVTQLVFERALKMRFVDEENGGDGQMEEDEDAASTPTTLVHTPEETRMAEESHTAERQDRAQQSDDTVADGPQQAGDSQDAKKGEASEVVEDAPLSGATRQSRVHQSSNLVGKLMNLVSTDLGNITDGEFLFCFVGCAGRTH